MFSGLILAFAHVAFCDTIPLYGGVQDFGYYFFDISIGTPPQRMSVILDTGSEGISVACSGCACGPEHMDPFFNPLVSSTVRDPEECTNVAFLRNANCMYTKRYMEGSQLKGKYKVDRIFAEPDPVLESRFGCIESETKLFLNQKANGIFGLAPLPKTYWLEGMYAFTVCLAEDGGDLSFWRDKEGVPVSIIPHKVPLKYVKGHYVVSPSRVSIGPEWSSEDITGMFGTEVLIDSGSTHTYLMSKLFDTVLGIIESNLAGTGVVRDDTGSTVCWVTSGPSFDLTQFLPEIVITFPSLDESSLNTTIREYAYTLEGKQCLMLASNGRMQRTDLGSSWMRNRALTFTKSDGWLGIRDPGNCTVRAFVNRPQVIAIPGQLDTSPPPPESDSSPMLLSVLALLALAALLLMIVVRMTITRGPVYVAPNVSETQIE
jgi:hypothetical protein